MKRKSLNALLLGSMLLAVPHASNADSITKPHTFTSNTPAKASEVNADFDTVYDQVNKIGAEVNIDSANHRVGIGTTSPISTLEVKSNIAGQGRVSVDETATGSTNNPGFNIYNKGEFQGGFFYREQSDSVTLFSSDDSGVGLESLVIDNNGNVGIGTSTPEDDLTISGTSNIGDDDDSVFVFIENKGSGYAGLGIMMGDNSTNEWALTTCGDGCPAEEQGKLQIIANTNQAETKVMVLDQNGRVGIGTATPGYKLDVLGDLNFSGDIYKNGSLFTESAWSTTGLDIYYNSGLVGIGTITPGSMLHVLRSDGGGWEILRVEQVSETSFGAGVNLFKSRGTPEAKTVPNEGDWLGSVTAQGFDGSSYQIGARVGFVSDGASGSNDMPGRIVFQTTPDGSATKQTRMVIKNNGNVGIGTMYPGSMLETSGEGSKVANSVTAYGGDGSSSVMPVLLTKRARGTADSPSAVLSGDILGWVGSKGYHGGTTSGWPAYSPVGVLFGSSEDHTDTARGTFMNFMTTPNGSVTKQTRMKISESGNIGIGTTAPTEILDVAGNIRTPENSYIGPSNTSGVSFQNGNVGIGTDSPGADVLQFSKTLHVKGAADTGIVLEGDGNGTDVASGINLADSDSSKVWSITNRGSLWNQNNLMFHQYDGTAWQQASLTLANDGNIGIGTTTPARKLHISDAMRLEPLVVAPSSPSAGDLYFDSSQALCVYVDNSWSNVAGSGTCTLPFVPKLPDTGQTTSYTTTHGEDSDYTINPPSYTLNGDETTTDNVTGLIWQSSGENIKRTWYDAITYCEGLELPTGQTGWRLPTDNELLGIVNHEIANPAIDQNFFPVTYSSHYWSSTTFAGNSSYAWGVNFSDGDEEDHGKTFSNYVRCVRGGQ